MLERQSEAAEHTREVQVLLVAESMQGDVWHEKRLRELYAAGWWSPETRFYRVHETYHADPDAAKDVSGFAARIDPPPDDFRDRYDAQYDLQGPYPALDPSVVKGTCRGWFALKGVAEPLCTLFPEETEVHEQMQREYAERRNLR